MPEFDSAEFPISYDMSYSDVRTEVSENLSTWGQEELGDRDMLRYAFNKTNQGTLLRNDSALEAMKRKVEKEKGGCVFFKVSRYSC